MVRTSEYGGVEYAIRRIFDNAWLYDGDMDGVDVAWEPDADDATWCETKDQAINLADLNGLTDEDENLLPEYRMFERDWINEEEITEEYETPEPRPVQ